MVRGRVRVSSSAVVSAPEGIGLQAGGIRAAGCRLGAQGCRLGYRVAGWG